ncbi:MarR family winged helix-turn-helix transcriptional regulator [Tenggerimyces flavus]|uniref:MarR family winged helix-turn-helix transcriptional regulator n=1 Tax=Tenggerimyces flavus TaxID=1708749 RepID=A0ABV7YDG5_9ACTN|nr:MarR family transcriptional regulator [Tenggerimyces flavus]MBM7789085.1 DNA-binding MarR family transcriptional regulator [Tenggerimyces flavus]
MPNVPDPTDESIWRPLRLLQARMDDDIARLYVESDLPELKPSYVMELLRLHARGPMTIKDLATSVHRTHSAMSQKVAAMRAAGLVETTAGSDARNKVVDLTDKSRQIVEKLAAEWQATEAALVALEDELPYPLSKAVQDIEKALVHKSFHDRILDQLRGSTAWE